MLLANYKELIFFGIDIWQKNYYNLFHLSIKEKKKKKHAQESENFREMFANSKR